MDVSTVQSEKVLPGLDNVEWSELSKGILGRPMGGEARLGGLIDECEVGCRDSSEDISQELPDIRS